MTARRRTRRSLTEAVAQAMHLAQQGPFTPGELAAALEFTPNRARQLLSQLKDDGKVEVIGTRRSVRGKPSQLWGVPGTEVTEEDQKARPAAKKAPKRERKVPKEVPVRPLKNPPPAIMPAGGGFFDRLFGALKTGIEIEDPEGAVYTIRLAKK